MGHRTNACSSLALDSLGTDLDTTLSLLAGMLVTLKRWDDDVALPSDCPVPGRSCAQCDPQGIKADAAAAAGEDDVVPVVYFPAKGAYLCVACLKSIAPRLRTRSSSRGGQHGHHRIRQFNWSYSHFGNVDGLTGAELSSLYMLSQRCADFLLPPHTTSGESVSLLRAVRATLPPSFTLTSHSNDPSAQAKQGYKLFLDDRIMREG